MVDAKSWMGLPAERTFSHYDEFHQLFDYVEAYFSGGPMFENIREEMGGLRYHLQPLVRSGYFTDADMGTNLGVARSTARRFYVKGRDITHETFVKMMRALADQGGISDARYSEMPKSPHDAQVELEGVAVTARGEAHDAIDELLEQLHAMIPASEHTADCNRAPIELTVESELDCNGCLPSAKSRSR